MTPNHAPQPLLGDVLALISAIFYASYVVFLKVKVEVESLIDMQLFLGFVGLFDLLTCWPVGVILHWMDMEKFELPSTTTQWSALLANVRVFFPRAFGQNSATDACRWRFSSLVIICMFSPC
jgi:solute carrier family 35 protein F5